MARYYCHPSCINPFCHFHRIFYVLYKLILKRFVSAGYVGFSPINFMSNKNTHCHLQLAHFFPNVILLLYRAIFHTIIFQRSKSMIMHKLKLINKIITGIVFKHSEMRSIIQVKSLIRNNFF